MRRRDLYLRTGFALAAVIAPAGLVAAGVIAFIVFAHGRPPVDAIIGYGVAYGVVAATLLLAIVIHEVAHVFAARLVGSRVTAIHVGSPPVLRSVRVRNLELQLGIRPHGRVVYVRRASATRNALILAAGSAANLLSGAVLLVVPLAPAFRYPAAMTFAIVGLTNLLPYRSPTTGMLSDGGQLVRGKRQRRARRDVRELLSLPSWQAQPDAAGRLLRGIQFDVPAATKALSQLAALLLKSGAIGDLLWVHRQRVSLPDYPATRWVSTVHAFEWAVATIPDLPLADANEAGRRMAWVLQHSRPQDRGIAQHTLAVIRLRQGLPGEVEPLCANLLATSLTPSRHATVLATVAMARHAQGLSGQEKLAEAAQLDANAKLVQEALSKLAKPQPCLKQTTARGRTVPRARTR